MDTFFNKCNSSLTPQYCYYSSFALIRVVTKILRCRVNTTSRRGIKRLRISFGSIFLLSSNKSSQGLLSQQPGKISGPRLLMTTLLNTAYLGVFSFVFSLTWNKGLVQCKTVSLFRFLGVGFGWFNLVGGFASSYYFLSCLYIFIHMYT